MKHSNSFEGLTPDIMIGAVEDALGVSMTGLAAPLPSYINRVYEFQSSDGKRYIAKFYRPGRWSRQAILEEHSFVLGCAEVELPVVPPLKLDSGSTLGESDGIFFAVYPKRSGRELEIKSEDDWLRLGRALARMHLVGESAQAPSRTVLHPVETTERQLEYLLENEIVSSSYRTDFEDVCRRIIDDIIPLFEDAEMIRIHGDCHRANILERPGEGIMIIDFDDMMTGPPVQDLWLLLPDHAHNCRYEIDLLAGGYEEFRDFDYSSLKLIEPLRAMRIIYFLAWCSTQTDDYRFKNNFPEWGTDSFWTRETADLERQLKSIEHSIAPTISHSSGYVGRILTDH